MKVVRGYVRKPWLEILFHQGMQCKCSGGYSGGCNRYAAEDPMKVAMEKGEEAMVGETMPPEDAMYIQKRMLYMK